MLTIEQVVAVLERLAPRGLAEDWDNVGLLVGDRGRAVRKIMTCLTITPASAAEALAERVDLIVAHHPLPFRPLKRLTTDGTEGRMLWELIGAQVAIYSAHTAFDSATDGINERLARGLGLTAIAPLVEPLVPAAPGVGGGRYGVLEPTTTLAELVERVKKFLNVEGLHVVGRDDRAARKVAVACGSGGEFLAAAARRGCDALVTGEARFHTCLEAESQDLALVLPGHYASERFAVEALAATLAAECPSAAVWASRDERDPLRWT